MDDVTRRTVLRSVGVTVGATVAAASLVHEAAARTAPFGPDDPYDLVVRGGEVLDPSQNLKGRRDIGIRNALIAAVEPEIAAARGTQTLDASGQLVLPGLVDFHAHVLPGGGLGLSGDELVPFTGTTTYTFDAANRLTLEQFSAPGEAMSLTLSYDARNELTGETRAMSVTPGSVSLHANVTQQFNATVTNAVNQAVTWSVTSGPGTISASGVYTSPATVAVKAACKPTTSTFPSPDLVSSVMTGNAVRLIRFSDCSPPECYSPRAALSHHLAGIR